VGLFLYIYALTYIYVSSYTQIVPTLIAFDVLAEPHRRDILELLRSGERPVGDLVDQLELSQPAVSKHLRVLKDAGLVEVRADAQRRLYRISPEPLEALDEWLEPYRQFWSIHLDRLETHLDQRRKK
jgi:DNA-binding transcriptional ArsR family regulator